MIYWLIVGLLAGAIASSVRGRTDFGCLGNLLLGIVGSVVGGFVFSLVGLKAFGLIGELLMSVFGAIIVLAVADRAGRR